MSLRSFRSSRLVLALPALLAVACLGPDGPSGEVDANTRRALSVGDVVGAEGKFGNHEWRGIPFAAPAAGELRWRAPRAPEPWEGVREAVSNPPVCPQMAPPGGAADGAEAGTATGSEDCLYLNVFAPKFAPGEVPTGDERLPVMFWIHGGGNTIGDVAIYDGGALANEHGVIVVAVQYRLGPFGWFSHRALRSQGADDASRSGNFGTLDLVRALEFVRDEIAAFGGDAGNVTIFGESAGGSNVITLLLARPAAGLFHRAVVQSGSGRLRPPHTAEDFGAADGGATTSNDLLLHLLVDEGTADDADAARTLLARMDDGEIARFLRTRSTAQILSGYGERMGGMIAVPTLFGDGDVLPRDTFTAFEAGDYNHVPVIFGTNRDETKLFQVGDGELVDFLFGFYPRIKDWDDYDKRAEYGSKLWKAVGVDELARRARRVQGPSVYAYRFDWDEEPTRFFLDFSRIFGAAHALEIPFVFGNFDLGWLSYPLFSDDNEPGRLALSRKMMSYWVQFARTGSPGRGVEGDQLEWGAWDESSDHAPRLMVFDTEQDGGTRMVAETVTKQTVIAEVAADLRFADDAERCALLRADRRRYIEPADLVSLCDPPALQAASH